MKKLFAVLCCLMLSACCMFAASCGGGNAFVFLSVRMKGNGDGSITAVAQKEFSLGSTAFPVTLTLYSSHEYTNDVARMAEVDTVSISLGKENKTSILAEVKEECYYCARIAYTLNGEGRYIQSDTILYGKDGNRK